MKKRQKKWVGYLHLPVCTYSGMAGRRLELEEEATSEMILSNRVSAECAGMEHY